MYTSYVYVIRSEKTAHFVQELVCRFTSIYYLCTFPKSMYVTLVWKIAFISKLHPKALTVSAWLSLDIGLFSQILAITYTVP